MAKAHGGPIEIFGVTVAQVDDKVRLQELDTWFDPLEMFRQIAPHGIVNKEAMNRKVDLESALDVGKDFTPAEAAQTNGAKTGEPAQPIAATQPLAEPVIPDNDGIKIAEEHNQPGKEITAPEEVIPQHNSDSTGQPADVFVPHQGADTDKPASESNPSDSVPASKLVEAAATHGAEAEIEHPESNFHDAHEHQPNGHNSADTAEKKDETAPSSDVRRSIYSSAVTGNEEDRIKMAKAGEVKDESKAYGVYDAVDEHLEKSAEQVHPHPHDTEKAVQPEGGEAVAVPAQAEETRLTHEEMSRITPSECPFLMNRE